MDLSSYCVILILVAIALPWYTATGQTLSLAPNPVNENDDVMGSCNHPGGTGALFVVVDGVINGGGVIPVAVSAGSVTTFTLPNVTRSSNGIVFSCQVQVNLDLVMFGNITLIVNFAPNYTDVPVDQEINRGSALDLTFNLEAQPSTGDNFTYTWTRNGVPFTSSSNVAVTATSISITSAECSDNGLYNLTATNPLGSDSVSFRLTVLCPPTFEAGSGPIPISTMTGQNFSINCRVSESYPQNPTITLTRPGSAMPDDITANPSQYFSLSLAGNYTYMCIANNTRATTSLTYQVSVTMPSTTPTTDPTTGTPTIVTVPPGFSSTIGIIIGVVVGVSVLACVISILVPVLICCCLGVGVFATIGCLSKNKKKNESAELSKL